jgi:NodT family efflux transporter outer membrane factor (OMF) lipoprotein
VRAGIAAALLPIAAGVAGCVPAREPVPAAASVIPPSGWRTAAGPMAEIAADWWRALGDPVLDQLVSQALAANPDIAIARARVREARAQEALARAQLLPTLDLGVGASRARSLSAFGTASTASAAQPVFEAAYEVDLSGRIGNQVGAARLATAASEAAREGNRLSVAAAAVSGYVTLRGLDARRALAVATVTERAEALRIAGDRARTGYTSQLELRQAEADYRSVTQLVPQVDLAIARQEDALAVLLGLSPRTIPRGLALDALHPLPAPAALPSQLLLRRPDLAQAELTLAAADRRIAAARAQFLPRLNLAASAGAVLSDALPDPVTIWSLGGSVLAPLFEGGRLRAGVETATAQRDQAAFAYQRTVLTAFREVEDNLAAADRLAGQQAELEAQRAALAEAVRHARNRYEAGYTSYLEQLDAQRSLLGAELALVQVRTDRTNAFVALAQAAGGGWSR